MTPAQLRAARSTDAGAVGAILSEFIDSTPWMPRLHTRAQDVAFAGRMIDQGWVTVATHHGSVTGFVAREGEQLNALYISGRARGRGIGSTLLWSAKARVSRLTLWTFQANAAAQAFYVRHGFTACECTDGAGNDEGLPDTRFEWTRRAF